MKRVLASFVAGGLVAAACDLYIRSVEMAFDLGVMYGFGASDVPEMLRDWIRVTA